MKHLNAVLVVCSWMLALLILVPTMSAQEPQAVEQLAIQLYEGQISLYNVDATGQFTFLNTLEGFNLTRLSYRADAEWEIVLPSDIALSPDGRYIAFTAFSNDNDTALFLYNIGQFSLLRFDSPGIGTLMWSPGSDAILLVPHHIFTSGLLPIVEDGYLYTLASSSFTQILDLPEGLVGDFMWLPGGEYVYEVPAEGSSSTTHFLNLYVADSLGQQRVLADLETLLTGTQVPLTLWCSSDNFYWSSVEQRLYYAANCDADPWLNSALYSVDLQGNNRLEVDLKALYPEDVATYVQSLYIDPSNGDVFVLVNAYKDEMVNERLRGLNHWRVLSNSSGQWEELIDATSPPGTAMGISPDRQRVAVGGLGALTGFLSIADLASGEVSERENNRAVCNIQWVSADVLRYTQSTGCATGYNNSGQTWELNTVTGEATQITGGLEGVVWLLPPQETFRH